MRFLCKAPLDGEMTLREEMICRYVGNVGSLYVTGR